MSELHATAVPAPSAMVTLLSGAMALVLFVHASAHALFVPAVFALSPEDRATWVAGVCVVDGVMFALALGVAITTILQMMPLFRASSRGTQALLSQAAFQDALCGAARFVKLAIVPYLVGVFVVPTTLADISWFTRIDVALFLLGSGVLLVTLVVVVWKRILERWIRAFPPAEVAQAWTRSVDSRKGQRQTALGRSVAGHMFTTALGSGLMVLSLAARQGLSPSVVIASVLLLGLLALLGRTGRRAGIAVEVDRTALTERIRMLTRAMGTPAERSLAADLTDGLRTQAARQLAVAVRDRVGTFARSAGHEEEVRQSVQEGQRFKTMFMASMSHDLRSPLNSILGFSDLLQTGVGGELRPAQLESVAMIQKSGGDLLQLLNDILDSARLDAGRMPLRLAWTPSVEILTEALRQGRELAGRWSAEDACDIDVELQPGLPPVYVDSLQIVRAVVCLFRHAAMAMDGGTIRMRARVAPGSRGTRHVQVEVTDTGGGIRREDRERIFEAFHAITASSGRRIGGLGLSLSLARTLVQSNGGDISFATESGAGTTFTVTLPTEVPQVPAKRASR